MDLATAMGCALFGMFTGGTLFFSISWPNNWSAAFVLPLSRSVPRQVGLGRHCQSRLGPFPSGFCARANTRTATLSSKTATMATVSAPLRRDAFACS